MVSANLAVSLPVIPDVCISWSIYVCLSLSVCMFVHISILVIFLLTQIACYSVKVIYYYSIAKDRENIYTLLVYKVKDYCYY